MAEQKLFFEDVTEGDEAPALEHTITRTDLVRYAGASGDFNPMHHDEIKATAAGMPSVFGHGMLSMGILGKALTDWVGVGNLRRFHVRFTKQSWPDKAYTTSVRVVGKRKEDDVNIVDLECSLVGDDGVAIVMGDAEAALPARG